MINKWVYKYSKKIKDNFFPKSFKKENVIADYYLWIMLFLYPLFLMDDQIIQPFTGKTLLYYCVTILSFILCVFYLKRIKVRKFRSEELIMVLITLLLAGRIVLRFVQRDMNYEKEIFLWCLFGTYFLLRGISHGYVNYYLNLLLFSGSLIYVGYLKVYIWKGSSILGVETIIGQSEAFASFSILITCVSCVLYCLDKRRIWETFYLCISIISFVVLSFQMDMMAVYLTGVFLLIIPLVFSPTVILIKKNLTLCFLFLLILSNIPFLFLVSHVEKESGFSVQYSIYIDLLLCMIGFLLCCYWEKIPSNCEPGRILMKKVQRWYGRILAVMAVIFMVCLLIGNRISELPERFGIKTLKTFNMSLLQSIQTNKSLFQILLEDYGVIGGFLWSCLVIMFMKRIINQWKKVDLLVKVYLMVTVLFLVQTFFYKLQPISSPLYIIVLALGLWGEQKKDKVQGDNVSG